VQTYSGKDQAGEARALCTNGSLSPVFYFLSIRVTF
jgi:hypothetical protein